jgi:hypothetical protein
MNKIKLKKFRYSLDWFVITDEEIDLDKWSYFLLDCRGTMGDWYLIFFNKVDKNGDECESCGQFYQECTYESFNLNDPVDAVIKLGQKLKGFRYTHGFENGQSRISELLEGVKSKRLEV